MIDCRETVSVRQDVSAPTGAPLLREEACTPAMARRVAAMLDRDPAELRAGSCLPRGWHFVLLAADTPRSALRRDGFAGLGVPIPDQGLPRLMLGSRQVSFAADIPIGEVVERESVVRSVTPKTTAAGPMAVVTVAHTLRLGALALLEETQTYLLLPARQDPVATPAVTLQTAPKAKHQKTVVPDDTLLFQYSALGFNSHRIHLDRRHAREVEGFPDLVVNGGLTTLLLTEFLRVDLGLVPAAFSVRHLAPLYCDRPITLAAESAGERWHLQAFDELNRVAVDMEVTVR